MDATGDSEPGFDLGLPAPAKSPQGYRVLARKYRPATFDDLIGQEAMVRTLSNAFETGRIAQAYVFTGVRGVGKTTTARILARALNYEIPGEIDRPTIRLDRLGRHCQAIMEGRHVDVMEIDAASHTGIDDVRQITEGVRYAPVSARYKVYIVDEVHMLSEKAWNAFLKTLEEPPPHVKFMFATTEIRKVPVTVLSRCQRFDLRRVEADRVTGHLLGIAAKEGVTLDGDAAALIARAGEGSVRDSLSMLDQAIAHSGTEAGAGSVTAETVRQMLGLADRSRILDLFGMVMKGDLAGALAEMRSLHADGADPALVLSDLAETVHLVTRIKVVASAADDVTLTPAERERGRMFAEGLSHRVLARAWQMLVKGIDEVERSQKPLQSADMVLVRIAHAADLPTPDEALKMIADWRASGEAPSGVRPPTSGAPPQASMSASNPAPSSGPRMGLVPRSSEQPAPAPRPDPAPVVTQPAVRLRSFPDLVALAGEKRDLRLKASLERDIRLVGFEDGCLTIALEPSAPSSLVGDLQKRLGEWTGRRWVVVVSSEAGEPTLKEQRDAEQADRERGVRAHPSVRELLERFPGAEIIAVRPLAGADSADRAAAPSADDDTAAPIDPAEAAPWDYDPLDEDF